MQQICAQPEAAGQQVKSAIQAGGSQAQAAVLALFQVFTLVRAQEGVCSTRGVFHKQCVDSQLQLSARRTHL